jgi:non-specific serine/threonine protein kinase
MLYQMVTGRVPFSDYDEQAILSQHLEESVTPPSESRDGVPPALEAIILRLLAKNPGDRFASAREVGEALERIRKATERQTPVENLPAPPPALAATEDETMQVKQLLESSRLVTLLGEDSRKTSLALATGAKLMEEFSDGVWLIELAPIPDPAALPSRVASILGVPEAPDRTMVRSLMEYLAEKNTLFIFDQCDHLRGACAQLAETILQRCPEVRILATCREPLNLPEEACYRLPD